MLNIHNFVLDGTKSSDSILQSFNAFDPRVANSPDQTLNFTENFRNEKWNDKLVIESLLPTYTCHFNESKSAESEAANYSHSVGIEGSYGFFSASMKYSSSTKTTRSSTAFYSSTNCMIHQGTLHLENNTKILDLLQRELVDALKGIKNMTDAENFTKKYGTHIITSVNLGGLLSINTEIHTSSYSKLSTASIEVSAKYSALSSISATAQAASEISNEKSYGRVIQATKTIGGDAIVASQVNLSNAESVMRWAQTCSKSSVYGISSSKEYWSLVENTEAGNILKNYVYLVVLAQSLKNPTIFTAIAPTISEKENQAIATVSDGFRIIGGGAYVQKGTSSFLCGSYPQLNDRNEINGWIAASHDCAIRSSADDVLISFAMAVYDPLNLLDTRIEINTMEHQGQGGTFGNATVDPRFCLTGGGCSYSTLKSRNLKYITSNYPEGQNWMVVMSDYEAPASDATVKIYAIGFTPSSKIGGALRLSKNITKHSGSSPTSQGDINVTLNDNLRIAGGGMSLTQPASGNGNLAQQCFPGTNNQWSEYNSDLNGSFSRVVPTAHAINLTIDSAPLTLKGF